MHLVWQSMFQDTKGVLCTSTTPILGRSYDHGICFSQCCSPNSPSLRVGCTFRTTMLTLGEESNTGMGKSFMQRVISLKHLAICCQVGNSAYRMKATLALLCYHEMSK